MATQQSSPTVQYREMLSECQKLMNKVAELEVDRNEHQLVEETLKPLDPERRAYRLVGEVLVERTVKEVLPSVISNRENVSQCLWNEGRKEYNKSSRLLVFMERRLMHNSHGFCACISSFFSSRIRSTHCENA
jgi:chaperonin cofactor prefoldin